MALLTREGVRERPVERVQLVTLGSCGSTVASTAPMESRDHAPGALLPWWVRKVVASPWRDTQAIFVELKDIGLPPATGPVPAGTATPLELTAAIAPRTINAGAGP